MEFEKIENGIKAKIPLITEDIRAIDNDFDGIINRFTKMIIKEKDLAKAQYIIKKQQEQINELKRNSISKKKIEDKIKELETKKEYKAEPTLLPHTYELSQPGINPYHIVEKIITLDEVGKILQELLEEDK